MYELHLTKYFQETFVNCEATFLCCVFACYLKKSTIAKLRAFFFLPDYSIAKSPDINTGSRKEKDGCWRYSN